MDPLKLFIGGLVTLGVGVIAASSVYQIGKSPNAVPLFADANATVRSITGTLFKG